MVGLPTAIPGSQSDLTAYAPMQPATYPFAGQQYPVPYQGQIIGHQGQSYPSPLPPSLIGMNTAQVAAAAVRTSVGPQTEGMISLLKQNFLQFYQRQLTLIQTPYLNMKDLMFWLEVLMLCKFYYTVQQSTVVNL